MPDEYIETVENEANFDDMDLENAVVTHGRSENTNSVDDSNEVNDTEEVEDEVEDTTDDSEKEIDSNDKDFDDDTVEDSVEKEVDESVEEDNSSDTEDDYVDESEYYNELSETTGYEISSNEDIIAAYQRLDELEQLAENPYKDLPKEAQLVLNALNSGEDYKSKLRILALDTDNISPKDALKENYALNNNSNKSKELLDLEFEDDYNSKYGILDELNALTDPIERAEFESEHAREIKLANLKLEQDVKDAKNKINEFVSENKSEVVDNSQAREEEERQQKEWMDNHLREAKTVAEDFQGITFVFGENAEDEFTINSNTPEEIEARNQFLENPIPFFKEEVGIDLSTGQITDYNKLSWIREVISNYDKLPELLGKRYMEVDDRKSVKEIVENREKPKHKNSKPQAQGKGINLDFGADYPD